MAVCDVMTLRIGEAVELGPEGSPISASVNAISIRWHEQKRFTIQYECVWWDGRTRHTAWCDEGEVRVQRKTGSTKIGFAN